MLHRRTAGATDAFASASSLFEAGEIRLKESSVVRRFALRVSFATARPKVSAQAVGFIALFACDKAHIPDDDTSRNVFKYLKLKIKKEPAESP